MRRKLLLGVLGCLCGLLVAAARAQEGADDLLLRFSSVGDSRQDPDYPDPGLQPLSGQDRIWLQNSKALTRILRGIEGQGSRLLFFNGDMIMGYGLAGPTRSTSVADVAGSDLMAFYRQYGFWRGMVAPLMEAGTYVVPVPGNHEVQSKARGKLAQPENEDAWRANMGDLILDTRRFEQIVGRAPSAIDVRDHAAQDGLSSDQSQLSYSFDVGPVHFSIINTDPAGRDGSVPLAWLTEDLQRAKARGARHLFVFGHKPAFTYAWSLKDAEPNAVGLDRLPAQRDAFWDLIERHGATYFCGHQHEFALQQPRGAAWQVLVGSGGSPWDVRPGQPSRNPETDRAYVWATVSVYRSGRVDLEAWGFDEHFGPLRRLRQVQIGP